MIFRFPDDLNLQGFTEGLNITHVFVKNPCFFQEKNQKKMWFLVHFFSIGIIFLFFHAEQPGKWACLILFHSLLATLLFTNVVFLSSSVVGQTVMRFQMLFSGVVSVIFLLLEHCCLSSYKTFTIQLETFQNFSHLLFAYHALEVASLFTHLCPHAC